MLTCSVFFETKTHMACLYLCFRVCPHGLSSPAVCICQLLTPRAAGEIDTQVTLHLRRPGSAEETHVTLTRAVIPDHPIPSALR